MPLKYLLGGIRLFARDTSPTLDRMAPEGSLFRDWYDASIRGMDVEIGRLLERLRYIQ